MANIDSHNNGCTTLTKLWDVALECNIEQPGIYGVADRMIGLIQCKNIRDFMTMATMKCWVATSSMKVDIS